MNTNSINSGSPLLQERSATHGDFNVNAAIAQKLKDLIRTGHNYDILNAVQKEALDAVMCKTARILSGNPDEPDHWRDIGGYAKLAENDAQQTQDAITAEMQEALGKAAVLNEGAKKGVRKTVAAKRGR